jgi:hypothetical protein
MKGCVGIGKGPAQDVAVLIEPLKWPGEAWFMPRALSLLHRFAARRGIHNLCRSAASINVSSSRRTDCL